MKQIYYVNAALFGYKYYQREISKTGIGSELNLKAKKKANGYTDVFAYNGSEEIGSFFREESSELLPFVSNSTIFSIQAKVTKLLQKESDMASVIVDVSVYSDQNIDSDKYIEEFYDMYSSDEKEEQADKDFNSNLEKEKMIVAQRKYELFGGSPPEVSADISSSLGIASNTLLKIKQINPILLKIKYIHGIPNIDTPCFVSFDPKKDKIDFLNTSNNNHVFFSLKKEQIKNISVEDQTTIEKRIGFKRLLLVGIFAFAWKKKQVNTLSYLIFEYIDDVGLEQEMYIQSEHKNGLQTFNNLKYNLYKFWKEAETNPNIDRVIEETAKQKKELEEVSNSEALKGCMVIIIAILAIIFMLKMCS